MLTNFSVFIQFYVGKIITALETNGLLDKVNLIISSDHGMVDITKVVEATSYLDLYDQEIEVVEQGPYLALNVFSTDANKIEKVYNALKGLPYGTAYKKEEFPEKWHYRKHSNIPHFLVLGNESTYYNVCYTSAKFCFNEILT